MANEIRMTKTVNLLKGTMKHEFNQPSWSLTQTGILVYDNVHIIGTTEETLGPNFGDIDVEGWCSILNLDSTNYIQVGFSTGLYGMRLRAGFPNADFYLEPGTTLYLKANTAACNARIIVYEY